MRYAFFCLVFVTVPLLRPIAGLSKHRIVLIVCNKFAATKWFCEIIRFAFAFCISLLEMNTP